MARPQIPDAEKERIEEIYESYRGYPAKSFQEAISTVADLAERESKEVELDEKVPFQFDVEDCSSGIKLMLLPKSESDIERTSEGLQTSKALIDSKELYDELKQIEGVRNAHGISESIDVILRDDIDRSFDQVIDDVFSTLAMVIQRQENKVKHIEERASQYATQGDVSNK